MCFAIYVQFNKNSDVWISKPKTLLRVILNILFSNIVKSIVNLVQLSL